MARSLLWRQPIWLGLVHATQDWQTKRAYLELGDADDDGGEMHAGAIFSYPACVHLNQRQIEEEIVRKDRLFGRERHGPVLRAWPSYETRYLCAEAPSETLERMTRTELLDAATEKLVEAAKLLDRADEDTLADDALELAERVNLRIALN